MDQHPDTWTAEGVKGGVIGFYREIMGIRSSTSARSNFRSGRCWAMGILGWCGNITALMIFAICGRTPKSCPGRTHALPDLAGEWRMSMLLFVATITLLSFGYVPALDE